MTPTIKRSIRLGFFAANKSWRGLAFYLSIFLSTVGFGLLLSILVRPPEIPTKNLLGIINTFSPSMVRDDQMVPASSNDQRVVFIRQLQQTWLISSLYFLVLFSISIWLYGGQIGYLAGQLKNPTTLLSEFWKAGNRAFFPMAGALAATGMIWLLTMLFMRFLVDFNTPLIAIFIFFGEAVVGIGLMLWLIIIVLEKTNTIEALRRSIHFLKIHGAKYAGICLLLGFVSVLLRLIFAYVESLHLFRDPATLGASILIHKAVYFYLQFVFTAELIQYYSDAKEAEMNS